MRYPSPAVAEMASAEMRNSHAEPSSRRREVISRDSSWGSTTRSTRVQLLAPRVCALINSSAGISCARCSRSRASIGVIPMTISITFDSSSRPKTINSTGRIASGGIIDTTVSSGDSAARYIGKTPAAMPMTRPISDETARPVSRRLRLISVSAHSRYSPLRLSGVNAIRSMAATICDRPGSNLSCGLASSRTADPINQAAISTTKGSSISVRRIPFWG